MHAGLGSDTYNHLAGVAAILKVDINQVDDLGRIELLDAAERCCEARRLNEGTGVLEADGALKTLLSKYRS